MNTEKIKLHMLLNLVQTANVLRSVETDTGTIRIGEITLPKLRPFMDLRVRNQVVTSCAPGLYYEVRRWPLGKRLKWAARALLTQSLKPPTSPTSFAIVDNHIQRCPNLPADPPEPPMFDVTDYYQPGDIDDAAAIQRAMDAASAAVSAVAPSWVVHESRKDS